MKRILLFMALVLGLCIAHDAHAQNLTVKITQTNGTSTTVSGKASLQAALNGYTLGQVQALEISAGNFIATDWRWLKTNRNNISALQDFTIKMAMGACADIPNTVENNSFFNPSSLKTLRVSVNNIGDYAFSNCTSLTTATFPWVASIGNYAFSNCTNLTTLKIRATPPTVENASAFEGCPTVRNLVFVEVNDTPLLGSAYNTAVRNYQAHAGYNPADGLWYGWKFFDINLYVTITTTTGSTFTRVGMRLSDAIGDVALGTIKSLSITGSDFATVDWDWLKTNSTALNALQDFTIQETIGSVADIPGTIFTEPYFNQSSLKTLNVAKVAKIGNQAFAYCNFLTTATFPKATSIETRAFYGCDSLTTANFPQATSIGGYAFTGCTSLNTIYLGATPPTVAHANAFSGCPATRYLVPTNASGTALTGTALESAIQQYKADPGYNAADDRWYGWILEYKYTVTVDPGITHGTLTATPNNDVLYGTTVRLTTTPATGYKLKAGSLRAYRTGSPNTAVAVTNGTFTMPAYDVTVTCEFEAITYTWVQAVTAQPAGWDPMNIDSPEDLAWFISHVNGYNGCAMHPTANARITADLDMSAYQWVPIGSQVSILDPGRDDYYSSPIDGYHGKFDGAYHAIKGLRNDSEVVSRPGLFDKIVDGTVENVIVTDCDFHVGQLDTEDYFGILANEVTTASTDKSIRFSEVSGKLTADFISAEIPAHLGGLVGAVMGHYIVHSCISQAMLKGQRMGGLVGKSNGGIFNNYAYPLFQIADVNMESRLGGLVYANSGHVENCYIREREAVNGYSGVKALMELAGLTNNQAGCLVHSNQTEFRFCYIPEDYAALALNYDPLNGQGPFSVSPVYIGLYTPTETPYMYRHADNKVSKVDPNDPTMIYIGDATDRNFVDVLNAWVDDHQNEAPDGLPYAKWSRTCASPVNDDYPVLLMPGANAVASDGDVLYYGEGNDLLLKNLDTPSQTDDAVFQYDDARLTLEAMIQSTKEYYIGEGVCVLPHYLDGPYVNGPAKTHVGVTFDNSATGRDWHLFSSSLTNAPLGVDYGGDNTEYPFSYTNPGTQYNFYDESVQDGFFPSKEYGTGANYYDHWDFYTYDEPSYHFINFKRNSNSHWHQDGNHANITYANEKTLLQGKGYMMAIDQPTFMQAKGVLNNSPVSHPVSHSAEINPGYNLVGNPYQAILDFDEVAEWNSSYFGNNMSYTTYDADKGGYVSYVSPKGGGMSLSNGASTGAIVASRYISPLQGFFVYHPDRPTDRGIEFEPWYCKTRAYVDNTYQGFRGGEEPAQPTFPLVNLIATDDKGKNDILVVEFDRPENGGARKMIPVRSGKGSLYARHQDENMSIAFVEEGITEIPVRFETIEDAVFTMTSLPANGPFRYLHLIDNITGIDHDLLADSTFTFEAKASDYKSRFKLVIALEAVEEAEDDVIADQFAYFDGGTWIVEAKGDMEVYDLTGRLLLSMHLANTQNSIDLSGLSVGVYLMRVSNGSDVKMQKIVLK